MDALLQPASTSSTTAAEDGRQRLLLLRHPGPCSDQQQLELQQLGRSTGMDQHQLSPESVPLLTEGHQPQHQQKAEVKRSKLLTVCPFILGAWLMWSSSHTVLFFGQ